MRLREEVAEPQPHEMCGGAGRIGHPSALGFKGLLGL